MGGNKSEAENQGAESLRAEHAVLIIIQDMSLFNIWYAFLVPAPGQRRHQPLAESPGDQQTCTKATKVPELYAIEASCKPMKLNNT